MASELVNHIIAFAAVIYKADKGGAQLTVCNILRHIPAHAAVDMLHPAHIPSGMNKAGFGISLDIHENSANHNNTHILSSFRLNLCYYTIPPPICNKNRCFPFLQFVTSTKIDFHIIFLLQSEKDGFIMYPSKYLNYLEGLPYVWKCTSRIHGPHHYPRTGSGFYR
jgi:hypothetical protein